VDLLTQLRCHTPGDEKERCDLERILGFLAQHPNPFDRHIAAGHLTGSAVIVEGSGQRVLLLRHRKLQRWLQPGGHADPGELTGEAVALREAREETGLTELRLHAAAPRPLDVDVHAIPARPGEPAHAHLDLRYLVEAGGASALVRAADESEDLRWFTWDATWQLDLDAGLRRALAKARQVLGVGGFWGAEPPA